MHKPLLSFILITCCTTALLATDDQEKKENKDIYSILQKLFDTAKEIVHFDWSAHMGKQPNFSKECFERLENFRKNNTLPFSNTPEDQEAKSNAALYALGENPTPEKRAQLRETAIMANQRGLQLHQRGNNSAPYILLMAVPIRKVRALGLIALGATIAHKYDASDDTPFYDIDKICAASSPKKQEPFSRESFS